MIVAVAVSIIKTAHFIYYNSQKRIAEKVEQLLGDDSDDSDLMNTSEDTKGSTVEDYSGLR